MFAVQSIQGKISILIYLFVPKIGNKVRIPVLICFKEHFNVKLLSLVERERKGDVNFGPILATLH